MATPSGLSICKKGSGRNKKARPCPTSWCKRPRAEPLAYVQGISTRSVDDLVRAMGANGMCVSRLCAEINDQVNAFLTRPLEGALALPLAGCHLPQGALGRADRQPCRGLPACARERRRWGHAYGHQHPPGRSPRSKSGTHSGLLTSACHCATCPARGKPHGRYEGQGPHGRRVDRQSSGEQVPT